MFGVNNGQMNLQQLMQIANSINKPEDLFKQVYDTNPQFKQFVEESKGKTIEQMIADAGIKL